MKYKTSPDGPYVVIKSKRWWEPAFTFNFRKRRAQKAMENITRFNLEAQGISVLGTPRKEREAIRAFTKPTT